MSESNTVCPFCDRPPGAWHTDECPRSRKRQRELPRSRPRLFWTKGPIAYRLRGQTEAKLTHNPGIPFVRSGKWFRGGVPRDTSAVDNFLRSIGLKSGGPS